MFTWNVESIQLLNENNNILCIKKTGLKHKKQNLSTSSFDILNQMDLIVKGCLCTLGCLHHPLLPDPLDASSYSSCCDKIYPDVSKCPLDVLSPLIKDYWWEGKLQLAWLIEFYLHRFLCFLFSRLVYDWVGRMSSLSF